MSKKARTRHNRRDRRKAKQSNFSRPGNSNPKKIGHGGGGQVSPKKTKPFKKATKHIGNGDVSDALTYKLGEELKLLRREK
jgi:hypothetical protein